MTGGSKCSLFYSYVHKNVLIVLVANLICCMVANPQPYIYWFLRYDSLSMGLHMTHSLPLDYSSPPRYNSQNAQGASNFAVQPAAAPVKIILHLLGDSINVGVVQEFFSFFCRAFSVGNWRSSLAKSPLGLVGRCKSDSSYKGKVGWHSQAGF